MKIELGLLYRSFQRALLFNIPENVRMVSFEQISDNTINILVVSLVELDEHSKDYLYGAAGEVEGDFVDIKECTLTFVVDSGPIDLIPRLNSIAFAMAV